MKIKDKDTSETCLKQVSHLRYKFSNRLSNVVLTRAGLLGRACPNPCERM